MAPAGLAANGAAMKQLRRRPSALRVGDVLVDGEAAHDSRRLHRMTAALTTAQSPFDKKLPQPPRAAVPLAIRLRRYRGGGGNVVMSR